MGTLHSIPPTHLCDFLQRYIERTYTQVLCKLINFQWKNNPKVGLGLTTLMVEFARTQSLEKSIDTQMNFGECILGYPLSFRGTYIIPTKEPTHRIILETMSTSP